MPKNAKLNFSLDMLLPELKLSPCRLSYRPVNNVVLLGVHTALVANAFEKTVPLVAKLSILGVSMIG